MRQRALQEAFFSKATVRQKTYGLNCNSIPTKSGEATESVGLNHSSVEVSVMEVERRVQLINLY
jgi:hypothetical protein